MELFLVPSALFFVQDIYEEQQNHLYKQVINLLRRRAGKVSQGATFELKVGFCSRIVRHVCESVGLELKLKPRGWATLQVPAGKAVEVLSGLLNSEDIPSVVAKGTRISLKINQLGYSSPIGSLRVRGQLQMKLLF